MAVEWTDQLFQSAYRVYVGDPSHERFGEWVGYGRLAMEQAYRSDVDGLTLYEERRDKLLESFTFGATDRILIGGAGFGFLVEAFRDAGLDNCWGIDSAPYIDSNASTEMRGDVIVVNEDIRGGGQVRQALRDATGDTTFDWVITEDLLTSFAVDEMPDVFAAAESVLANGRPTTSIVHMVTTDPVSPPFTSMTLEEWRAQEPTHSWVSIRLGRWRVL